MPDINWTTRLNSLEQRQSESDVAYIFKCATETICIHHIASIGWGFLYSESKVDENNYPNLLNEGYKSRYGQNWTAEIALESAVGELRKMGNPPIRILEFLLAKWEELSL